ncbi:PucR family transcriptional regulator [Cryptosporangium sp. NPDC051539]|uniref:PucR family transcriptional regulator n=1 Tax=Cryptosporangium sp. NPDC051539 TaxID=3363962 RepID=UPI00379A8FF1
MNTISLCDQVAAAVAQDAGPTDLTLAIAEASGRSVVLLDPSFAPVAVAEGTPPGNLRSWHDAAERAPELLRAIAAEHKPALLPRPSATAPGNWLVAPALTAGQLRGFLIVVDASPASELDLVAVSYLARMVGLALPPPGPGEDARRHYRSAILDSLISGHFESRTDARGQARSLDLSDSGRLRIAVARGATGGMPATAPLPSVRRGTDLVIALPERSAPGAPDPLDPFRVRRITVGLSEPALPEQVPAALRQAQYAAELGIRLGRRGQTIRYQDLGIFRLLLRAEDLHHLRSYAEGVLGTLLDYDALHRPDLIRTLSTYLAQNGSPKQTARVLRVHVNTVAYRIQRIESLTGLDLTDPDDRLGAHVAVKIVESLPRKDNP